MALSWQVAILKILAASECGEVPVASIARDLSILVSSNGWEEGLRRSIPASRAHNIFSNALVDRTAKGVWRILPAGRDYLLSLENVFEFAEAAE